MIYTENLSKHFPPARRNGHEIVAVEGVDLDVHRGEVFGFLGPNGAGKTTTIRMLCALIAPTSGTAVVNGYRVGPDNQAIRAGVGILTETPGLYAKLDAVANLTFFAKLYGVEDIEGQVARYLKMLDLWDRRGEQVGGFSKGMRQKLAIARALLHEPPLLFLDEPTSGLDPEAAHTVREFIAELRGEGRTIFLSTHNLDEADRLCDRIALIKQRLISVDTPARLRQQLYGQQVRIRLRAVEDQHVSAVKALPFVQQVERADNTLMVKLGSPQEENPSLVRALVAAGADVLYVEEASHSLEAVYFELMARTREEDAA